ncbi:hypothetical protein IVB22_33135 [Bradyrhizobium sp. 190]|uniref:hypothetical protein n=1 Tax=Bradyrhizobium sp. 190 TaxID=2782658 RepID=UPI001FF82578|nr:hypothetical protein [Bradyrhizobium sp. 190]MCK1517265.1 hypothetical protein [Bradyrhizobium sp. 190]
MSCDQLQCCAICPHENDCRKVGACLDDVNAEHLAITHRQHPRLMTPAQATKCMDALKNKTTLRRIFGCSKENVIIVTSGKFRNHCKGYPEWGAEAARLASENTKAADKLKGGDRRNQTRCKRGHSLADAYIHVSPEGWVMRNCRTCHEARRDKVQPLPPNKLRQVESMLMTGKPIAEITGKTLRGIKRPVIVNSALFRNARKADPAFDLFVRQHTADSIRNSQKLRWALYRARAATAERREQANDYQRIVGMLPIYLSGREDIAHDIFVALCENSLRREDVPERVKWYIKDHERRFPTKYAKFGDSPLVSLDEVLFDSGTATRGDTVSRGLWD